MLVTDRDQIVDDALGGRAYYLARAELEIPLGAGARELGLRPSIFVAWSARCSAIKRPLPTAVFPVDRRRQRRAAAPDAAHSTIRGQSALHRPDRRHGQCRAAIDDLPDRLFDDARRRLHRHLDQHPLARQTRRRSGSASSAIAPSRASRSVSASTGTRRSARLRIDVAKALLTQPGRRHQTRHLQRRNAVLMTDHVQDRGCRRCHCSDSAARPGCGARAQPRAGRLGARLSRDRRLRRPRSRSSKAYQAAAAPDPDARTRRRSTRYNARSTALQQELAALGRSRNPHAASRTTLPKRRADQDPGVPDRASRAQPDRSSRRSTAPVARAQAYAARADRRRSSSAAVRSAIDRQAQRQLIVRPEAVDLRAARPPTSPPAITAAARTRWCRPSAITPPANWQPGQASSQPQARRCAPPPAATPATRCSEAAGDATRRRLERWARSISGG